MRSFNEGEPVYSSKFGKGILLAVVDTKAEDGK